MPFHYYQAAATSFATKLVKRRMLVAALLAMWPGAVLEYDIENFSRAAFLLESVPVCIS
eukprot:m.176619 g.176619  ORF g.176619 m.176619 type:complete len:59 (-) comp14629_c0_seq5:421-597(-)